MQAIISGRSGGFPPPQQIWLPSSFSRTSPVMRRLFARLLLFAALAAGADAAERQPSPLPPINADLVGTFAVPKIPGLPPVAWRVQARPVALGSGLLFDAAATAPGLEVRLEFTLPVGDVAGTWRLAPTKIDAASWWRLTAEQAAVKALPSDFTFAGQLALEGSGEWRGAEATGTLQATLVAGSAGSENQHWSAAGLRVHAELGISSSRVVVRTARIRVETLQVAGIPARQLHLEAAGAEGGRFVIQRAEVFALGGRIALTPFNLDPAAPAVKSVADFSGVALGELAALVPQALKAAQGQIAGRVSLDWSLRSGLGPGDALIDISSASPATVSLAASPGLLTGNSPPRIALLPASFGPLRQWFSFDNPAHRLLRRIELGETPLAVESLSVQFYPDGVGGARSLNVKFSARPSGRADVVDKVTFNVNVSGPLDQVLRLGLDDRAKIRFDAAK